MDIMKAPCLQTSIKMYADTGLSVLISIKLLVNLRV